MHPRPVVRTSPVTTVPRPFLPDEPPPWEEVRELRYGGYRYDCRVLHQPRARTEPVLVLGGAAQDKYSWARQEPEVTRHATMIAVDLPGWGAWDAPPAHYGMDFLADAVRHAMDELGVARVTLVGACYGGTIGLRLAQRSPGRIARLLLVSTAHVLPEDVRATLRQTVTLLRRGDQEAFAALLTEVLASAEETGTVRRRGAVVRLLRRQFQRMDAAQTARFVENTERLLLHPLYRPDPLPPVPTMFLYGVLDRFTCPDRGAELAATLPGCLHTTMHSTGHMLTLERPELFTELLVRFATDRPFDDLPSCTTRRTPATARARERGGEVRGHGNGDRGA
ncbi:alpha/beta hydrolase [Streptomyces sp. TRM 70351]|uniref:alpha/beta fold hydrolase n=1 Tax=Streptomyces sp. TRM 70351 TaxID=3116552 RepID=UPI002E7B2084|nr:alpha/beta hydrolase [Streptomyces sp. TRM 70351]MEE1927154.1 alpha/beta hydrolase [Streptomyces sp. TRM 70351]